LPTEGTKNICKFEVQKPGQIYTKIGFIVLQSNKHLSLFLLLLAFGTSLVYAQEDPIKPLPIKALQDSIVAPLLPANIIQDSTVTDTTAVDSLSNKEVFLLDKIKYKAKDYVRLSKKENKIYLYNEAEIYYQDTELKAGIIIMDYVKNEVYAGRLKDSLGNYSQLPFFKQGNNEVTPDSIRFNFDTQKALIWNSRTEQQAGLGTIGSDNMKVYASLTKKENDSVYFLSEGKLTTSKDTVNPDYYIRIRKAKFVPKKKIIAGYSNLYIADVPTPVALPFAYFPLSTGRTAGLIFPTYGNDPDRGFFLQNGGYYFPISDYVDLNVSGDFYTNGSYGFRTQSVYAKRYKFRGNINFNFENLITSQPGFSDFTRTTVYNVRISHSQDPKANPNSRFSASVNLGSSQFFRESLNQLNLPNTLNNNLSSSISYSKTFPKYPAVNLSLTATHNQNTNTESISLTLPTFQGSVERIFPFAKRDGIKKGLLQNINFQYNVRGENRITTNDEDFLTGRMFDDARVGARHTIPVSTNFKLAKHFSVTLGGTYEDIWTLETFNQRQDTTSNTIVRDTIRGFDRFNQYNLSTSIGTTIYGTFNFGEDKKIQAIRHVLRPSLSYGYSPSFDQFFQDLLDDSGNQVLNQNGEVVRFSRFEGTLNGSPRLSRSNALSFSLQNSLEAKVRSKDSTATEPKKITLLNNLNFTTAYNFEADSLQLSPVNFTGGTTLLNNKMQVNFGGSLDPYAIDNNGTRINTFNINNGGSLFRLTRANMNVSYSITSAEIFGKKDKDKDRERERDRDNQSYTDAGGRDDDLFGSSLGNQGSRFLNGADSETEDVENPIYGTKLPWDLRLAYTTTFNNSNRQGEFTNNSLMFSGNIQLAPRWELGVSSGYDFTNNGFSLTQFRFSRDLKSFVLRFNWVPFGNFTRWNFFIGIKSSILKDLKFENRSQPPQQR